MNLYIDIETIPNIDFKDEIIVSPPGNMSKPETIELWEKGEGKYAGQKEAAIEAEFRKFGFNGTKGKIFCIGFAFDDEPIQSVSCINEGEKSMLIHFLKELHTRTYRHHGRPEQLKWIGHYITGFDLRFIWQRCVINGARPLIKIPYDAKPWETKEVFDTCTQWKGNSSASSSLDAMCKAFGIKGKDGMDGSKVYDEYLAGNYQKITDYCKDDTDKVRQIYKRINFL